MTAPQAAAAPATTVTADEELAGIDATPVVRPIFSVQPVRKPPPRHARVWK
jgi:hypothetical protein